MVIDMDKENKAKIDEKTGEEYLLCPRCKVYMEKLVKKDVVIDVCQKCKGMWVDAGELEKLAEIGKEETKR
jgi:Zn-finger nucleic acid-binding protein